MRVETFVDIVIFLVKVTAIAGVLALVLKIASALFGEKDDK